MESLSRPFCSKLEELLSAQAEHNRVHLVATIPTARFPDGRRGIRIIDNLIKQPGIKIFEVTFGNRDNLVETISADLLSKFGDT